MRSSIGFAAKNGVVVTLGKAIQFHNEIQCWRYRRRLLQFTDAELVKAGKACSPPASQHGNPFTQEENALKYVALKQEWRRRHPKTSNVGDSI